MTLIILCDPHRSFVASHEIAEMKSNNLGRSLFLRGIYLHLEGFPDRVMTISFSAAADIKMNIAYN